MSEEKQLTEQESLQLIANMIKKAKGSYHDTGIGSLLWGSVVSIASFVSYLQREYNFTLAIDIWWLVFAAIAPQVYLSIKEKKHLKAKQYDDDVINAVWLVFGISIFALSFYQNIVPIQTEKLFSQDGVTLMKHYANGRPDEIIKPFTRLMLTHIMLLSRIPQLTTQRMKKLGA